MQSKRSNKNKRPTPAIQAKSPKKKATSKTPAIGVSMQSMLGGGQKVARRENIGSDSCRVPFRQPLSIGINRVLDTGFFNGPNLAAIYSTNYILANPQQLKGGLLGEAQFWAEFRWEEFLIEYRPSAATTQAGTFALAVSFQSPAQVAADLTSFATVRQCNQSVTGPYWAPMSLRVKMEDPAWKRVDFSVTGGLTDVLSVPFVIAAFCSATIATALTMGYFDISGVCSFRNRLPAQGLSLSVANEHHHRLMSKVYQTMFPKREVASVVAEDEADLETELTERLRQIISGPSDTVSEKSWGSAGRRK